MKKLSKSEILTILKQAEIEFIIGKEPKPEMTEEEAKEKGYIEVKIPFPGYYNSTFISSMASEEEDIQERQQEWEEADVALDGWTNSPGWKKFLSTLTTEEEKQEYLTGNKHLSLSIPVDQDSFIHAGIVAVDDIIEDTILKDKIHPLMNWEFHKIDRITDYFYGNDTLYFLIPKEEMEEMMVPEMFKSKWYKKFADYRTTARSGYTPFPWHTPDRYFNREDSLCHEATILFWVAMGLYSRTNYIKPLTIKEADKINADTFIDVFSEEQGLNQSVIETQLNDHIEEDGFFPLNYKESEAL